MENIQLLNTSDTITLPEFKRLLHELKDNGTHICIRLRMLGQMWQNQFLRVFVVTDNGAVLMDQNTNKIEIVTSLSDIVQFELDTRYQTFHPFNHYKVDP